MALKVFLNRKDVFPPDQDFSELSPRKQPPYLRVRLRQRPVY